MTQVTELVTKFGFEGSTGPLEDYNKGLSTSIRRIGIFAAAAVAGIAALSAFTTSQNGAKKATITLAENLGTTLQRLEELEQISSTSGAAQGALSSTMQTLSDIAADSKFGSFNEGMLMLGINTLDANDKLKTSEQLFFEISETLSGMERMDQISMLNMLGIDQSMLNMLNKSRTAIEANARELRKFGEITAEDEKGIDRYNDSIENLSYGFGRLKDSIAIQLSPALEEMNDQLAGIVKSQKFKEFISGVGTALNGTLKFVTKYSTEIGIFVGAFLGTKGALMVVSLFKKVFLGLKNVFTKIMPFLKTIGRVLVPIFTKAFHALRWILTPVGIALAAIAFVVQDVITAFQGGESVTSSIIRTFKEAGEQAMVLAGIFKDKVTSAIGGVVDKIKELVGWVKELFNAGFEKVMNIKGKVGSVFSDVSDSVTGFFGGESEAAASSFGGRNSSRVTSNKNDVTINIKSTDPKAAAINAVEQWKRQVGNFDRETLRNGSQ